MTLLSVRAAALVVCWVLAAGVIGAANARQLKQEPAPTTVAYMISFTGKPEEGAFKNTVAGAGCTVDYFNHEVGFATVVCPAGVALSTTTAGFAGLGVDGVVEDDTEDYSDDDDVTDGGYGAGGDKFRTAAGVGSGRRSAQAAVSTASFYTGPLKESGVGQPTDEFWRWQWSVRAMGAPAAWAKGINGRCARVALVDGPFNNISVNEDLINKFDHTVSKSFTDFPFGFYPNSAGRAQPRGHLFSSIIAAEANNGKGTVGIAYGATMLAVEVYDWRTRSRRSQGIKAIIYAAERKSKGGAGADIIQGYGLRYWKNNLTKWENSTKVPGAKTAMQMINKALAFANKNGVLYVFPHAKIYQPSNEMRTFTSALCDSPNVLCVQTVGPASPTCGDTPCLDSPVGFQCPKAPFDTSGLAWNLTNPTEYGRSVDVSAFGGDYLKGGPDDNWCVASDAIVISGVNWSGGSLQLFYGHRAGQAFAASQVTALAALYIQKAAMDKGVLESELCNPNRVKTFVSPNQIKNAILRGAVMPPGSGNVQQKKLMYGAGIISAPRTLGL